MPERPLPKPVISRLKRMIKDEDLRSKRRFWSRVIRKNRKKRLNYYLYRLLAKTTRPNSYKRIHAFFERLNLADHRAELDNGLNGGKDSKKWGGRVRYLSMSYRHPEKGYKEGYPKIAARKDSFEDIKVVLKRVHQGDTAKSTIKEINQIVDEWGKAKKKYVKEYGPVNHVLLKPYAYAVGKDIVAMARTDKPSISEILGGRNGKNQTSRGQNFFIRLGVSRNQLTKEMRKLELLSGMNSNNITLLGVKNGEFLFSPLIDLE